MTFKNQKPDSNQKLARAGFLTGTASGFCFLVSAFLLGGCSSTSPEDLPEPVRVTEQAPRADPRVAEMQVLVAELLDRIEVLNARLQRLESGAPQPPSPSTARPA